MNAAFLLPAWKPFWCLQFSYVIKAQQQTDWNYQGLAYDWRTWPLLINKLYDSINKQLRLEPAGTLPDCAINYHPLLQPCYWKNSVSTLLFGEVPTNQPWDSLICHFDNILLHFQTAVIMQLPDTEGENLLDCWSMQYPECVSKLPVEEFIIAWPDNMRAVVIA